MFPYFFVGLCYTSCLCFVKSRISSLAKFVANLKKIKRFMEEKIIKFSPPHTISPYTVNPVIFEQAPANIKFPGKGGIVASHKSMKT